MASAAAGAGASRPSSAGAGGSMVEACPRFVWRDLPQNIPKRLSAYRNAAAMPLLKRA